MREKEIHLREYRTSDCKRIAELFYKTAHSVNAKDYQRQGTASRSCDSLERSVNAKSVMTHA